MVGPVGKQATRCHADAGDLYAATHSPADDRPPRLPMGDTLIRVMSLLLTSR
jgi:hypothetical protein